jgi:heat shock protein HtpX
MTVVIDRDSIRAARGRNLIQAAVLVATLASVLSLCLWLLAGELALVLMAGLLAAGFAAALRLPAIAVMRWHHGIPTQPGQLPELEQAVARLAARAGLPAAPRLYWLPGAQINAVTAGGRADSVIGISDGAFRSLTPREMVAVLGHEIAHIAAGDTRLLALAEMLSRLTRSAALVGLIICLMVLACSPDADAVPGWVIAVFGAATPLSVLLQLALSRNREFAADLNAVRLTGDAIALASTLEKIERLRTAVDRFGFLRPLPAPDSDLLHTHPATRERIQRLLDQVRLIPDPGPAPGPASAPLLMVPRWPDWPLSSPPSLRADFRGGFPEGFRGG